MSSKLQSGLDFGEITSGCHFEPEGPDPYFHWRSVNGFSALTTRSAFPQDLLCSFGAILTICRIQRNDTEVRVRAMASNQWHPESTGASGTTPTHPGQRETMSGVSAPTNVNLEELAGDLVERLMVASRCLTRAAAFWGLEEEATASLSSCSVRCSGPRASRALGSWLAKEASAPPLATPLIDDWQGIIEATRH